PAASTLVLLKVITGFLSPSRKFDERRSLSLTPLLVRMLAVEMVTSTEDVSGWPGSISAVALKSSKKPRTLILPPRFGEESIFVWEGGSCQLPTRWRPHLAAPVWTRRPDPAPMCLCSSLVEAAMLVEAALHIIPLPRPGLTHRLPGGRPGPGGSAAAGGWLPAGRRPGSSAAPPPGPPPSPAGARA